MAQTYSVSSSDTEMLLKLGIDSTEVISGGKQVEGALAGIDRAAIRTATQTPMLAKGMGTVGTAMRGVASSASSVSPGLISAAAQFGMVGSRAAGSALGLGTMAGGMRLVGTGARLAGAGVGALAGPLGLLVAVSFPFMIMGLQKLVQHFKESKKEAKQFADALDDIIKNANALEPFRKGTEESLTELNQALADSKAQLDIYKLALFGGGKIPGTNMFVEGIADSKKARDEMAKLQAAYDKALMARNALAVRAALNMQESLALAREQVALWDEIGAAPVMVREVPIKLVPSDPAVGPESGSSAETLQRFVDKVKVPKVKVEFEPMPDAGVRISRTIASGFADAFTSGEKGFADMLKRWTKMLLESAIFSLIMTLFNPGKTFGSFFGKALGFQHGTSYVPATGAYILHKGEAVVPPSQNVFNSTSATTNAGVTVQNVYVQGGASNMRELVKEIEKMARLRQNNIALVS